MKELTTVEARKHFSELINSAAFGKERIVLTRRGKGICAVIPLEDIEALQAIEDAADIRAAEAALDDPENTKRISWDDAKKALGL